MRLSVERLPLHRTDAVDLPAGSTGFDLFKRLDIAPDAHLLVRGDVPIPLDELLREGDALLVISVVSGGADGPPPPSRPAGPPRSRRQDPTKPLWPPRS